MTKEERELLNSRIISGVLLFRYKNKYIQLRHPTSLQQYMASLIYKDVYEECFNSDPPLFTEITLLEFMYNNNLWSEEQESEYRKIPKDIEEFKIKLYENIYRSNASNEIKKLLNNARKKYDELTAIKMEYNHLTCHGTATVAQNKYAIGISLFRSNELPVFTDDNFWESDDPILEHAINSRTKNYITESQFRELARNEPWRTIYNTGKTTQIFKVPSTEFTAEQQHLISWSILYDNIGQHHECPDNAVIEDDDALDGWLLIQKKKTENQMNEKMADALVTNDKIKNCSEIYIMADTPEDVKKIDNLNDQQAKFIKRQRWKKLQKEGEVLEQEMPDTKRHIHMEKNKLLTQGIRNGG